MTASPDTPSQIAAFDAALDKVALGRFMGCG
jgi:hypothetical protein